MTGPPYVFDDYTATMVAEGVLPNEGEAHVLAAWTYLVRTGLAWKLNGYFGRTAKALLDEGLISAE